MGRMTTRVTPRTVALVLAVAGTIVTVSVAWLSAMSAGDAFTLIAIAGGTAAGAALLAWLGLRWLGGRALAWQLAALACTATFATMIGAWFGARAMFFSSHDLAVLEVLLLAGGTVGCVSALLLGDRIGAVGADLTEATRRLGQGEVVETRHDGREPAELVHLARELEQTSTRLDESRQRERALENSRRELIAWISHDLRTPLAGIRAIAEALEDGVVDDQQTIDRYHATLRENADELAELIDDLFELSRTQHAVLDLEYQHVSLSDLVSDALAGVAPVADAKGVRLEGRMVGQPTELRASPPELLRALRNILENAVRHTPSDGSVVVEAGRDGTDAFVSVLDTGGGIAPNHLSRVFEVGFPCRCRAYTRRRHGPRARHCTRPGRGARGRDRGRQRERWCPVHGPAPGRPPLMGARGGVT